MKMIKINSIEEYNLLVENFYHKGCVSNNYLMPNEIQMLIEANALSYVSTESNIAFLVQKPKCKRVYYIISDFDQFLELTDSEYLVEILFRGNSFFPEMEVDYLKKCGFELNLIRDQYSSVYKDLQIQKNPTDVNISFASNLEDVKYACNLFNSSFDIYSGDYITTEEYEGLLENKSIILARKENLLVGALHRTIEKNTVWLSHIVVDEKARGMHIGKSLINFWIEDSKQSEKTRYMLWVQQQNIPAVKMYENEGFKYINKSTISLIKKQK